MKRVRFELSQIADADNLAQAAVNAAKGKRLRADVVHFFQDFDMNLKVVHV